MPLTLGLGLGLTHQKPVTGGGAPFSPDDISGLALWLDASDESTIDDSTATPDVDSWTDKSPNGLVFSQATASAKPHTGGTMNSLNTISFDGVNDYLLNVSATNFLDGQTGMIFAVLNYGGGGLKTFLAKSADNSTTRFARYTVNSSVQEFVQRDGGTTSATTGGSVSIGAPTLISVSSTGSAYTFTIDGADQTSSGSDNGNWFGDTTSTSDTFNLTIGANVRTSPSQEFTGEIAEIIYYQDVTLSASEIAIIEQYLANKWGITLA